MKREDDRILEFLESEGMASPELIAREAFRKVSAGHVKERLSMLQFAGLVFRVGTRSYELTGAGHRYLSGKLDADHLPTPTVDRIIKNSQN